MTVDNDDAINISILVIVSLILLIVLITFIVILVKLYRYASIFHAIHDELVNHFGIKAHKRKSRNVRYAGYYKTDPSILSYQVDSW